MNVLDFMALHCLPSVNLEVDSSVPLMHDDPKDLGLICLVKKCKIHFWILLDHLRIQSWIFLKKRTLNVSDQLWFFSPVVCHNQLAIFYLPS